MNRETGITKKTVVYFVAALVLFGQVCLAKYSGGAGTADAPYQLANAADILTLAVNTGDYNKRFILTTNIDLDPNLPGRQVFTDAVIAPDVNKANYYYDGISFSGILDGAGHKISNLTIDTNSAKGVYIGLFGYIDGEIKNLTLENVSVRSGDNSQCIGALAGGSSANVDGCFSTGSIQSGDFTRTLGGLVGDDSGSISDSSSTVNITGGQDSHSVGGLAGSCGDINNSYSTGAVIGGSGSSYLGGLAGFCVGSVLDSYSTGAVTGGSGSSYLGGLTGFCGGFIHDCYSVGAVTGDLAVYIGGLVGFSDGGTIISSYFLDTSGPNNGFGTSLTEAQMKLQESFIGWDFNDVWNIDEGSGYPQPVWLNVPRIYGVIRVAKCGVVSGRKLNTDRISFSGTMTATADDFNDANNNPDANFVEITVDANDMDPCVFTFPVNSKTFKRGKFKSTITSKPFRMSFAFDTIKMKLSFSTSNLDLTGLSCPVGIEINVGDWAGIAEVNEAIVNGKRPTPINLLMGVKDSLRVDKPKFTRNSVTGNITQFAVKGGFSVADLNDNDANMVVTGLDVNLASHDVNLASHKFTIPINTFKANKKGDRFSCSKVLLSGGETAAATFDFNKGSFVLTIKGTQITDAAGAADFKMEFGGFSEGAEVLLP